MRIGLDATYSTGNALSGVGVYSREILTGLAAAHPEVEWERFYRLKQFSAGVRHRLLTDFWGNRSADLFHGLNQRLPARRFRRQIATFHDLFVLSGTYSTEEFRRRFTDQARRAAETADVLIAVSEFTARQMEALLKVPRARIRVVHHGVVLRAIPDVAREKIVLSVGVIQRRKNQSALVRAFRGLSNDWTLVLAGSEAGYEAQAVRDEVLRSGCADRIRITGHIPDDELAALYGRASIFAFPSMDEGFGMPVLEAMAAGIPVITSNRSALPEIAGSAALLVDPAQDDHIAGALLRLCDDAGLRDRLISRGRARAADFTWPQAVDRTWNVYRELV